VKAVLGLKITAHDTGAAIVVENNGSLRVVAVSQERLDRVKHSRAFPQTAIDFCLSEASCRLSDISLVVTDFIWAPAPHDIFPGVNSASPKRRWWRRAPSAEPSSPADNPEVRRKFDFFRTLDSLGIPFLFAEHHLCHAASAYFATDWDDAVGLVIDGHGSYYETQTIFNCEGGSITKLATTHQPGIGWMYCAATEVLLGFGHLQEGKTMGLAGWASHGGPCQRQFDPDSRAGGPADTPYPQFLGENPGSYWTLAAPADMPRRKPDEEPTAPRFAQYAFAAQTALERGVMGLANYARKVSRKKRLCYAGGVALNIVANRGLLDAKVFDEVFIQPAASDAGIPLGAALLGYYSVLGGKQRWRMDSAFLARDYSSDEMAAAVGNWSGLRAEYQPSLLAAILNNAYLVAWFQGASEFGPRALGHRSILCCPRHPGMKAYLNQEVKHREMFRPFAPIVPAERQAEFFDLAQSSPYMLLNSAVLTHCAAQMPAIVHADGTARVQSVDRRQQPELHALLSEVGKLTGSPVLLNTSLNLAGEPIVETPGDTVDLFSRARLDVLAMGPYLLSKKPLGELLAGTNPGIASIVSKAA